MKTNLIAAALAFGICFSQTVSAREYTGDRAGKKNVPPKNSYKSEAGDCDAPSSARDLDINNVRAKLLNGGDMWWNLSDARYEVPKVDNPEVTPSVHALFAGAIWITGLDAGGNLKCAAQRYRAGGNDYFPGPLSSGGVVDKATCTKFDKHFVVYGAEIEEARTAFLATGGNQLPASTIAQNVLKWPAKGNPHLEADGYIITDNMAPFFDQDGDGIYDPTKGDRPAIYGSNEQNCSGDKAGAFADQMIFWVINDRGNNHAESNGEQMGIQLNCLAFAFKTTDDINNMTFYRYTITNKSPNAVLQTYISQWADPDLGNYQDDYVACDVGRSLGIVYNGDADDQNNPGAGVNGYGNQLPLLGIDFFEGPLSDSSQQLGLSSFTYFTNGAEACCSDPQSAAQYRNFQICQWNDGTPFTVGGTGYGGANPTCFLFPGNPSNATEWSECSANTNPDDRRFVQTSGPFTMYSGLVQNVTIGVVFVRPTGGVGTCPNFNSTIGIADDIAQALFDQCFQLIDGPDAPTLQIRELENEIIINLVNLQGSNNVGETYDQADAKIINICPTCDTTFTFEGYKLYQLSSSSVAPTDLEDVSKARLVAQVDVRNGISRIVNYEQDAVLGLTVPVLKVDGENKGITNSFKITQDLFATGNNKSLVNHRTYYFTAIAYAHNEYQAFDQNNPLAGGQKLPYLQGRKNYKVYSAIPHSSQARNDGTTVTSSWGAGTDVHRIEGKGNGAHYLILDSLTKLGIVNSQTAFKDTLTYLKNFDPIGFRVTDPIVLKEADFELRIVEADTAPVSSTSRWELHDLTNNRFIPSDRDMSRPYQQFILHSGSDGTLTDYGFSLEVGMPTPVYYTLKPLNTQQGTSQRDKPVYAPIGGDIIYSDVTRQWLSFLKDQGTDEVQNWIRSGTHYLTGTTPVPPTATVFDDHWDPVSTTQPVNYQLAHFMDSLEWFEKIADGRWAPYCLAASYAVETPDATTGAPGSCYGPGFKWHNYKQAFYPPLNTLDRLQSVDIVITPDKSKWSRCVVLETGEDKSLNEGADLFPRQSTALVNSGFGAFKGQIRMSLSKDFDGNGNLITVQGDTGRSWFPGYAINVETGERLNICFGESSDMPDYNGRDMLWNPISTVYGNITFNGAVIPRPPVFGGKHFIYVMDTKYDEGRSAQQLLLRTYDKITIQTTWKIDAEYQDFTRSLMWTSIPYLTQGYSFTDGYIPPNEVQVRLRVETPFGRLATNATQGDSLPRYFFSTKGMGVKQQQADVAKSALDNIRIVPNPYMAYSEYESGQNDNKVKITNLPNNCTITIFALDGAFIRKLSRSIGSNGDYRVEITDGSSSGNLNLDNSVEWDLKNDKGIPVSSGVYLFRVDAPGIGETTLRWFGAVRPTDVSGF